MNTSTSDLSSKQRAHLRRLAHGARPVLHVGKSGVTQAVISSLEEAFSNEELLKVKVLEGAPETVRTTAEALVSAVDSLQVVQVMGRIVTLFRRHPERPRIQFPN